ncbi:MFS multidrug transporter-like protein [Xylariales sp. AK1849]|nr:MFS multidrug transporter-like protein [Xylariales sp. AK1849]
MAPTNATEQVKDLSASSTYPSSRSAPLSSFPFPTTSPYANEIPAQNEHSVTSRVDRVSADLAEDEDDRILLKPAACMEELAFGFSFSRKWFILILISLVQISMNLNTTLYSNGINGIAAHFETSTAMAVWGAAVFLITYAFGCELWAPWSEEFGRKPILQLSLGLVNLMGLGVGFAPNIGTLLAFRALGGIFTAGGSVTLAVITDMFENKDPWYQYATLYIVFWSVAGSIIGPIAGGFIEEHLSWQWTIWVQIIIGVVVQMLHLVFVPETRATVMTDKIAKARRRSGADPQVYGPGEMAKRRIDCHETLAVWYRPFKMLLTEPIVLVLALLSGFSDALIFMCVQSFPIVYAQWYFTPIQMGFTFFSLLIGYAIAAMTFIPFIKRGNRLRTAQPDNEHAQYESRLSILLWQVLLLPLGLLVFGFTAAWSDPPIHWGWSMIANVMIGMANLGIYQASIDYTLRAYGPYAASATGGNGMARDILAGLLTPAAAPLYHGLGIFNTTMLLLALAAFLSISVYVVYFFGPTLRRRSKFAQDLADAEHEGVGRGNGPTTYLEPEMLPGSRSASRRQTPTASRIGSPTVQSRRNSAEIRSAEIRRRDAMDLADLIEIELNDIPRPARV